MDIFFLKKKAKLLPKRLKTRMDDEKQQIMINIKPM